MSRRNCPHQSLGVRARITDPSMLHQAGQEGAPTFLGVNVVLRGNQRVGHPADQGPELEEELTDRCRSTRGSSSITFRLRLKRASLWRHTPSLLALPARRSIGGLRSASTPNITPPSRRPTALTRGRARCCPRRGSSRRPPGPPARLGLPRRPTRSWRGRPLRLRRTGSLKTPRAPEAGTQQHSREGDRLGFVK
jgi:hypothetical protein